MTEDKPDFIIKGNPIIKKNGRPIHRNHRTGRPILGKSKKLIDAEADALWQIKEQSGDIIEPLPIAYKMHIKFLFFRADRRHVDLSNLYEFPQDILQKSGIIQNDCLIESHDGSRKLYDKSNPRTEIYICLYEEKKNDE